MASLEIAARQIHENVGSSIQTLEIPTELEANDVLSIRSTCPLPISSYNWINTQPGIQPTIMIPGNNYPTFFKNQL